MSPFFRMSRTAAVCALSLVSASFATASHAQADAARDTRVLIDAVEPGADGTVLVRVVAINSGEEAAAAMPERLAATLTVDGERYPVSLACTADGEGVAPGRFALTDCRFALPVAAAVGADMQLSLASSPSAYAFAMPAPAVPAGKSDDTRLALGLPLADSAVPSAEPDRGNAYLGNLSVYEPIYGAYGPGTNSDARIQLSFKYQLFGEAGDVGGDAPIVNGVHFGYTQRMFWDLGADSSPFRNIDFMPELFYLQPAVEVGSGLALGGQVGVRHESNGRDGLESRSANTVYLQPVGTFDVGDYTVSIGPRLFFYVGDLEDNPDIRRYRGSTGLLVEVGQDDGLRLKTSSRFNFSSGKGAIDGELSYPLDRIVETDLNLYVFGQAFAGYGENLLDYNRQTTRLRVGVAIVR